MQHQQLTPGTKIDCYRVLETIGQGGMGSVYRVLDENLNVDRALKLIHIKGEDKSAMTADEARMYESWAREVVQRFFREAQVLARFEHPNIIGVHRLAHVHLPVAIKGTAAVEMTEQPYIVMSYFPSMNAKRWSVTEAPSLERVLQVSRQITTALSVAHRSGVLHRDIKPQNILVGAADHTKVVDFGLAKCEFQSDSLTNTGITLGTPSYLAPEYLIADMNNRVHTVATDLWALGCTLYYLCTHRQVFPLEPGEKTGALFLKVARGKYTPVNQLRTDIAPAFADIIHGLLQPDPTLRIATAEVVLERMMQLGQAADASRPAWVPPARAVPTTTNAPQVREVSALTPETREGRAAGGSASKLESLVPLPVLSGEMPLPSMGLPLPSSLVVSGASAPSQIQLSSASPSPSRPHASSSNVDEQMLRALEFSALQPSRLAPLPSASALELQAPVAVATMAAVPNADDSILPPPSFAVPTPPVQAKTNATRGLMIPIIVVGVLLAVGTTLILGTGGKGNVPASAPTVNAVSSENAEKAAQAREMEALERERRRLAAEQSQRQAMLAAAVSQPLPATPPPPDPEPVEAAPETPKPERRRAPAPRAPQDEWSRRFGSAGLASGATASASTANPATASSGARSAGVKVPVRVDAELSSSPPGPVIAVVTAPTSIGDLILPVGTEIHGRTSGAANTRLLIEFSFALVNGKQVALAGTALGTDGKSGLPGRKTLTDGTDLAAGAGSSVVSNLANATADIVGDNPAGAAIRGASGPAARAPTRIDGNEDAVVTKRGARFFVYLMR